jgi:peptidoglycan/LPS O-acetylase OafA/YrhL
MHMPGAKVSAMLAYSVYLTHKEVAHLDELYLPSMMARNDWRSVVVIGANCLAAGAVLYFAVERPFLVLRDRRAERTAANVDLEGLVEPAL